MAASKFIALLDYRTLGLPCVHGFQVTFFIMDNISSLYTFTLHEYIYSFILIESEDKECLTGIVQGKLEGFY